MKDWLKHTGYCILISVLMLTSVPASLAQGGVTARVDGVDTSQFPRLTAQVTVIDENGLPITGLTADKFELIEDGQASFLPEKAEAVTNNKAAVSVLILLDLSATMKGQPLEAAKQATEKFLAKLLNESGDPDRVGFIGFGQQVDIKALALAQDSNREVPFTNDTGKLLNVVNFVEVDKNTGTPLYDAIYRAVKITASQPGRRAILVMTDGRDVGSTLKDSDPIAEAQRQHIPIFPIGLSNNRLDQGYLKRLAELTGGHYQEAPTPDEFVQKFDEVLSQLKIQYSLSYRTRIAKADGQYHSLLVRVNTPRGQSFDETKIQVGQPAATSAAAPLPGSSTSTGTPPPAAMAQLALPNATPTREVGMSSWISDNPLFAAGILLAVLLLGALIVLAVLLTRRRAAAGQASQAPAWPPEAYPAATPAWGGEAAAPPQARAAELGRAGGEAGRPDPIGMSPTGMQTGSSQVGAGRTEAGTWVAPTDLPVAPSPFGLPPDRADPQAPSPAEPADVEGTMVLQRGPKMKVLGFLVDRKQPSRRFDVDKPSVTIGRAAGNNIIIDHPTISRQHATIKLEGDDFRIYDLGSANGTFVGDTRVREPLILEDGATVRFGEAEFVFKLMSLR